MVKSASREKTLESADTSRPRRDISSNSEPPDQSHRDIRNDSPATNPCLGWGRRDLKGNCQPTHDRGNRQPRPQPLQVKKVVPATEASYSAVVQGDSGTPGFAHLRRNAISAGVSLDDYRYPNGQASRRELKEEVLRIRNKQRTLENRQPLPPRLVSSADSLTSLAEATDGSNMDENLGEDVLSPLPLRGIQPRSSKSTSRGTKRQEQ